MFKLKFEKGHVDYYFENKLNRFWYKKNLISDPHIAT